MLIWGLGCERAILIDPLIRVIVLRSPISSCLYFKGLNWRGEIQALVEVELAGPHLGFAPHSSCDNYNHHQTSKTAQ